MAFGLGGFLINHWLAIGREQRKGFSDASKEFSDAFIEIQRFLAINPPRDPAHPPEEWQNANKLVRKFYKKHHLAIIRFKPFIPWHKKRCFRKCWHGFCCYDEEAGEVTFSDYEPRQNEEEIIKWEMALSRIKKLLKFARV